MTASTLAQALGTTLRQLREQRGWSQEKLAEKADLNRSYVGELERGQALASLLTLEKLACAVQLSPASLLSRAEHLIEMRSLRGLKLSAIAC